MDHLKNGEQEIKHKKGNDKGDCIIRPGEGVKQNNRNIQEEAAHVNCQKNL